VRTNGAVRLALAGLVFSFSATADNAAQAEDDSPVNVLELFTSQGCSSCPPADALLGKMAKEQGVLALTMPVNYWDYLGWKDTLATESFSKRQRGYAENRGDHEIYTPQLIVNGIAHVVGSREDAINAAITRTSIMLKPARVPLKLSSEGGDVHVSVGAAPDGTEFKAGTIWLALYNRAVNVDIGRGENLGRKITYTNVVRHLVPAGRWDGQEVNFRVPLPASEKLDGCAAFLQADKERAIIGAGVLAAKTD
jgi:hypothetical protein